MQDVYGMLTTLHRPRLLIRAARLGLSEYKRDRHLQRLLGYGTLPRPAEAALRLMEMERDIDNERRCDAAGYSLPRHLDILIAIMGEAQLLSASRASGRSAT